MSFAAVQKHVVFSSAPGSSRSAGVAATAGRGLPETLAEARRALDDLEEVWRGRVERMSELLESDCNTQRKEASMSVTTVGPTSTT